MATDDLYSSLDIVSQKIILAMPAKDRVEALVIAAADKVNGGLHVLHESWTKHQLAQIYQSSPEFIDGTLVQEIGDYKLRVDLRDYLSQVKTLARNGHAKVGDPSQVFHGQSIEALEKTYYAESAWAVHGLIPEGASIIAGKPKQGKSYLTLNIALAVAKGGLCLDHFPVSRGDVLFFSLEDYAKRVQNRIKRLYTNKNTGNTIEFLYEAPKMSEGFGQRLRTTLSHRPTIRLVIIDTLRCIRDSQTEQYNLYQEDSDFIGGLNQCAQDAGISILIVHHTRKAKSEDVFDEISGTGGLRGATSANMVLEASKGEADGLFKIEGKDFDQGLTVALKRKDDGAWSYVGQGEIYQLRANKRAILDAIAELGDDAYAKDLFEVVKDKIKTISYGNVKTMLSRMSSLGEIGRTNKGVYFLLQEDSDSVTV